MSFIALCGEANSYLFDLQVTWKVFRRILT